MLKSACAVALFLGATVANAGVEYSIDLSGHCDGREAKLIEETPGQLKLLIRYGNTMATKANPGQVDIKACDIDWRIALPGNLKFKRFSLITKGYRYIGDKRTASAYVDHTFDHDVDVYSEFEHRTDNDPGNRGSENWDFEGVVRNANLPSRMRGCGATIQMYTDVQVKSHAYFNSTLPVENQMRKSTTQADWTDMAQIECEPCN